MLNLSSGLVDWTSLLGPHDYMQIFAVLPIFFIHRFDERDSCVSTQFINEKVKKSRTVMPVSNLCPG